MKHLFSAIFVMASLFSAQTASATDFNVRIINLSNGIYYTPFLVAAQTMTSVGSVNSLSAPITAACATGVPSRCP